MAQDLSSSLGAIFAACTAARDFFSFSNAILTALRTCSFCQNHDIAHQKNGFSLQPEELADWFIKLQDMGGVHNINLV